MNGKKSTKDVRREIRRQLKRSIPKMSDRAINYVVNLIGEHIDKKKRKNLKKEVELELTPKIEKAITRSYQIGLELTQELQLQKLSSSNLREQFYKITDITLKPLVAPDLPKRVHVFDYLFNVCEKLLKDFRFGYKFPKKTKYEEYLKSSDRLVYEIQKKRKITEAWQVLNEFRNSADFHVVLQATFQRVIKYYEFLERNFRRLGNK